MIEKEKTLTVPEEMIINKIYYIRGLKVILDRDLAEFTRWRRED